MTLAATIDLVVNSQYDSALDLSRVIDNLSKKYSVVLANGTGANKASKHWHDQRTIAASGTDALDLAGSLENALGETVTFTKIKAILVAAAAGNTNDVLVGGAASNAWAALFGDASDVVKVKPGGVFFLSAPDANGLAVTAGTGDQLKIANSSSGTTVTYDIIIIGEAS
jgi:hypothetical protein